MQVQPIDLRALDEKVANVYEAVVVAAKYARRINEEAKLEFNTLVTTIPSKGFEDDGEDVENPDQLKISLEFEKRPKSHLQALHEVLDGNVKFRYKNQE